jgi:hypothetical protein
MSRYAWVDASKAEGFEIKAACQVAEVSTSAYYVVLSSGIGPSVLACFGPSVVMGG